MKEDSLLTMAEATAWIASDAELLTILTIIQTWQLPDCWLVAGSIRNFLWDKLSDSLVQHASNDVDVAFFDPEFSYDNSEALAKTLAARQPGYHWEIKNQAHMHTHNFPDELPYRNTLEAVSRYPETCTALACRLADDGTVQLKAMWGLKDLANFQVRPTPHFALKPEYLAVYKRRVAGKNWQQNWPQLTIYY